MSFLSDLKCCVTMIVRCFFFMNDRLRRLKTPTEIANCDETPGKVFVRMAYRTDIFHGQIVGPENRGSSFCHGRILLACCSLNGIENRFDEWNRKHSQQRQCD